MEKIFLGMIDDLKKVEALKHFIAPKVEPPTSPGIKDLRELPRLLKIAYTLIEFYLSEINKEKAKDMGIRNDGLLVELELKREIATNVFKYRFCQKYGNDETISLYSDFKTTISRQTFCPGRP